MKEERAIYDGLLKVIGEIIERCKEWEARDPEERLRREKVWADFLHGSDTG